MKKRNFTLRLGLILFALVLLAGCYSKKELVYLQDSEFNKEYPTSIKNRRPDYRVQVNDVLQIDVRNPDPTTTALFSKSSGNMVNGNVNPAYLYLSGYSVDDGGFISIPIVGKVKVDGLTVNEAETLVQTEIDKYLNNASVEVKLVSFKISVLGEVNNPGYHLIYNGQANILEALAMAGDITQFGSRDEVKLIRQTNDGSEVILLDLRDAGLMNSKYFFLLPNDVLYVEPSKEQVKRANLEPLGVVFSALTTLALFINAYVNLTQ
ncbi:polysaccharide biosynthesis/export family protein [Porifericola rhodea]|uniref:polysaccharide biosynthesis/export family protein n=1 Tax=Porifericola rhodea TaxID=930972 RepID=UPI002664FBDD|nr:polysaccharide biosynthesis/export family protein [Porifericola rhodea]WKN30483.1 polysaccharide biosynthesis/export family protein [Porifericola rhodea]